jgi:manganese/iron transport system ATP-binding protein
MTKLRSYDKLVQAPSLGAGRVAVGLRCVDCPLAQCAGQRQEQNMSGFFAQPPRHQAHDPLLQLQGVTVTYGPTPAIDNLTFQVERGDQVAVVGPNGAGKSTLFNVITGIIKPASGNVQIGGSEPGGHICVGYVPQRNRIDQRFPVTVADVVMMGRVGKIGLLRWPRRQDRERVQTALAQVGMVDFARRQIGELSGGQQQRVFLARILAQEAELLLMDEPLSGLDLPSQEAILTILAGLRRQGITILVATHDLNQAAEHFSQILLLNRRLVAYGPPAEVLTPERLMLAYGSGMHVVHGDHDDLILTDSCCGGGDEAIRRQEFDLRN